MKNSLRIKSNQVENSTEISVFIKTMESLDELKALQSVMTVNLIKSFPNSKLIRYENIQESTPLGLLRNVRLFYKIEIPVSEEPE